MWETRYKCWYTCTGDVVVADLRERACFGDIFHTTLTKNSIIDYEIYIPLQGDNANFNLCSPIEMKYVLNKFREICPFSFKIDMTPHVYTHKKFGVIYFHVEGSQLMHKMVLTFSRCFFEYPYNVIVKETLNTYPKIIKELKLGYSISWMDVFCTIETCFYHEALHCFTAPWTQDVCLFTKDEIRDRITLFSNLSLNNFFDWGVTRLKKVDFVEPRNIESLMSEEAMNERVKVYVRLIKEKLKWIK